MYRDGAYFRQEAQKIVDKEGARYQKSTSGYSKGEYTARLDIPKMEYESVNEYLVTNYGFAIPTYSKYGRREKEDAKKELVKEIASALRLHYMRNYPQLVSEMWKYYQDKKEVRKDDIYFKGEVGRSVLDYFRLLDGEINPENWKNKNVYDGDVQTSFGNVTNFKELYYSVKEKAAHEWLKSNDNIREKWGSAPTTFIFDAENIPQVIEFEKKLDSPVSSSGSSETDYKNDVSALRVDYSSIENKSHTKIGYRPEFLKGNIRVGRSRNLYFPSDEVHQSYFAVVELDDILASHDESTFATTKGYPLDQMGKNINDRNYSGDKNAQAKVVSVAQKLSPAIIVSTSATAFGTPIITIDGVVVSGNNRTMSMKLAAKQYPEVYDEYLKELYSELNYGGYGIPMAAVYGNFKKPILVRVDLSVSNYNSTELNKYNKVRGKSEKSIDMAVRLSKQLSDNEGCKNMLIDLVSEQEVVSELYNDFSSVTRFKKILVDCNLITENEVSAFFSDRSLTDAGKLVYQTLLLSMVLEPKTIEISQNPGIKSATNAVTNAIIPVIKNKKFEHGNLNADINNALIIQNDMVSADYRNLAEFIKENTIFKENNEHKTRNAFIINWFLNQRVNDFKAALLKYNNSLESNQGASLFGDQLPPEQIFEEVFTKKVDPDVLNSLSIRFKEPKKAESAVSENVKKDTYNQDPEPTPIQKNENVNSRLTDILSKANKYL